MSKTFEQDADLDFHLVLAAYDPSIALQVAKIAVEKGYDTPDQIAARVNWLKTQPVQYRATVLARVAEAMDQKAKRENPISSN